jgi:hypothetical protein
MTAQLTGGTIAAGTAVQSFFLTAQVATFPASGYRSYTGSITFDAPILGVEVVTTSLNNTDSLLGAPGTVYPAPSDTNSGLELNTPGCQQGPPAATQCGDDEFSISADGHTLGFFMSTGQSEDQMRVILGVVKTPEPGSIGLAFLGLLLVAIPVAKQYRGRKSLRREA